MIQQEDLQFNQEIQKYQEEYIFEQHYVHGYLQNEIQIQECNNRDDYTNDQVNKYLGNYFRFFGKNDIDIVYLYFLSKKKQEQIMTILDKTQPAVSYNVNKIKKQMEFIVRILSDIDDFIIYITDKNNKMKTYDKQMLLLFFYSTSIIKTARLMNINNITCRSHLNILVNRMLSNGQIKMYNLFKYILNNLNNVKKIVLLKQQ